MQHSHVGLPDEGCHSVRIEIRQMEPKCRYKPRIVLRYKGIAQSTGLQTINAEPTASSLEGSY
jgi:hypothetical protein